MRWLVYLVLSALARAAPGRGTYPKSTIGGTALHREPHYDDEANGAPRYTNHLRRMQTASASCTESHSPASLLGECHFEASLPNSLLAAKGGAGYNLTSTLGTLMAHLLITAADAELKFDANATLNGCQLTDGVTLTYSAYLKLPTAVWAVVEGIVGQLQGMDPTQVDQLRNLAQDGLTVIGDKFKGEAQTALKGVWEQVNSRFGDFIDATGRFIKDAFTSAITNAGNAIGNAIGNVGNTIGNALGGLGRRRTQSKSSALSLLGGGFKVTKTCPTGQVCAQAAGDPFEMPANPMALSGSITLAPTSNELKVKVSDLLRKLGPKGIAVAEVMKAAGVDIDLTLREPAFTRDGVAMKVFAAVTILDVQQSAVCRGEPKYCCVQRSLAELACPGAGAADTVWGWVGQNSNFAEACQSSVACCVTPEKKCTFPVCAFQAADCSAATGELSKCKNPLCGVLKQGVWLLTKAVTGNASFAMIKEEFNVATLVYDNLPAASRPPWLKPDKIEFGDTSACFGFFGFYTGSVEDVVATSAVVAAATTVASPVFFAVGVLGFVLWTKKRKGGDPSYTYKQGWATGKQGLRARWARLKSSACCRPLCGACGACCGKLGALCGCLLARAGCKGCKCCNKGGQKKTAPGFAATGKKVKKAKPAQSKAKNGTGFKDSHAHKRSSTPPRKKKPGFGVSEPERHALVDLRPAGHHAVGAAGGAVGGAGTCTMLYAYDAAQNKDHFTVAQGETLQVINADDANWVLVSKGGAQGYIPRNRAQLN